MNEFKTSKNDITTNNLSVWFDYSKQRPDHAKRIENTAQSLSEKFIPKILTTIDPVKYKSIKLTKTRIDSDLPTYSVNRDDLIVGYFEISVDHSWSGRTFKKSYYLVPERKMRWSYIGKDEIPVVFCFFNKSLLDIVMINSKSVSSCKLEDANPENTNTVFNEVCYKVPMSKCKILDLTMYEEKPMFNFIFGSD